MNKYEFSGIYSTVVIQVISFYLTFDTIKCFAIIILRNFVRNEINYTY